MEFPVHLMRKKPIKTFTIKIEARTVCQPNDSAINETGKKTQKPPMGYTHGGFIEEFKDNPFHWINRLILVVCYHIVAPEILVGDCHIVAPSMC